LFDQRRFALGGAHKLVLHFWFFAKYELAFFKNSFSCFFSASSRVNLAFSSINRLSASVRDSLTLSLLRQL
jgi:hypothetical protein